MSDLCSIPIPARLLNPCLLHLQKLALELKCPFCLNLLSRPMLLPCNHILCNICIPISSQLGSECQLCNDQFSSGDVRPAPYMENIVTIYRSLDVTFTTDLLQPHTPDGGKVPLHLPVPTNVHVDSERKEPAGSPLEGNSSNGQSKFLLTTKKRVRASINSLDEETESSRKSGYSFPPMSSNQGFKSNDTQQGLSGQLKGEKLCTEERDFVQVIQSSPSTSPDGNKSLDGNCSGPGRSNDSIGIHPTKRVVDSNQVRPERKRIICIGEDCFQDSKRQKKSDNRLLDGCGTSNETAHLNGSCSKRITTSKSESKSRECCGVEAPTIDPFGTNQRICVFCQSSEVKDSTGVILHYVHGKEVEGEAAMSSNAIHVHKKCIEWTPQAYFVDETVENLNSEIARAAKLKCSHCGIRGAALGCYKKSCRKTYHVPCAVEISNCRWDMVNYLLLCPTHSKVKFPGEKSKSGKHVRKKHNPVPAAIASTKSISIEVPPNDPEQLVFCGSALSSEEKFQLVKFASHCGALVTKFWNPNVTHVIAATDSNGAYTRTLKVLKAILNGRWILTTNWIKASMEAMKPVEEEPYEVCRDKYGCCNGPKMGRLRAAMENAPKLFDGLVFYFFGDFVPGYKEDLVDLVRTAGGTIVKSKEDLVFEELVPTTIVVYNGDLMPEEDDHVGRKRIEAAKSFANQIGSKVIEHTWLLESIASCEMKPF